MFFNDFQLFLALFGPFAWPKMTKKSFFEALEGPKSVQKSPKASKNA